MNLKEWNRYVAKKKHIPLSEKFLSRRLNGVACPKCGSELFDNVNSIEPGQETLCVHCDNCEYHGQRSVEASKDSEFNISENTTPQDAKILSEMFREQNKQTIKNIEALKEKRWKQSKVRSALQFTALVISSFSTISGLVYLYSIFPK